jgi:hypothetical protein
MGKQFVLCVFFVVTFYYQSIYGADCSEACLVAADCINASCPVCMGSCIACSDLTTELSCTDVGSGASSSCSWSGSACIAGVGAPEIPYQIRPFLFFVVVLLAVYLSLKKSPASLVAVLLMFATALTHADPSASTQNVENTLGRLEQRLDSLLVSARRLLSSPTLGRANGAGGVFNARLTTESGVPISSSNRTAQSTIYLTPFQGNILYLFNGTGWGFYAFSEISLVLSSLTSGANYDVFVYLNTGSPALELSAAWTSDTVRNDALTKVNGILVKSGATTRRYVGTIRTTATNTTEDSESKRFVWNQYHRTLRNMLAIESTSSWTYAVTAIRAANGSTSNRLEYVAGQSDALVRANLKVYVSDLVSAGLCGVGIGVDSDTVDSSIIRTPYISGQLQPFGRQAEAHYFGYPGAGFHTLQWLEFGVAGNTCTFSNASGDAPNGIEGEVGG